MTMRRFATALGANLIALGLAVAVIWGGLEAYVSLSADDGMQFDIEMWKYATRIKRVSPNPLIGHEHRPNTAAHLMGADVAINSDGLRDRDYPVDKPPGTLRIMMLGDSLTFGWGVAEDQTFVRQLETMLRAGGLAAEVMNTGVGNYNTTMEVEYFLDRGHKYKPDIVILNYFINDAEPIPPHTPGFMELHSRAWVYFNARIDAARRMVGSGEKPNWQAYYTGLYDDKVNPGGWRAVEEAVAKLARHCAANGIRLMIVNYPEIRVLQPYPFADVTEKVRVLAGRHGAEFVDLLPAVAAEDPATLWVSVPDPHPNAKADRLFAKALYERLMADGSLSPRSKP
jgi:lysophospholipase L1-like esterase